MSPTSKRGASWGFAVILAAMLAMPQGHAAEALKEYRASLAVATTRAQENPTDTARQRDLSDSHQKVGDVLFAQGDLVGALAAYRTGRAVPEAPVPRGPSSRANARR